MLQDGATRERCHSNLYRALDVLFSVLAFQGAILGQRLAKKSIRPDGLAQIQVLAIRTRLPQDMAWASERK